MENLKLEKVDEAINVRESRFILRSEVMNEARNWHFENQAERTDDDGSDKRYENE